MEKLLLLCHSSEAAEEPKNELKRTILDRPAVSGSSCLDELYVTMNEILFRH